MLTIRRNCRGKKRTF